MWEITIIARQTKHKARDGALTGKECNFTLFKTKWLKIALDLKRKDIDKYDQRMCINGQIDKRPRA